MAQQRPRVAATMALLLLLAVVVAVAAAEPDSTPNGTKPSPPWPPPLPPPLPVPPRQTEIQLKLATEVQRKAAVASAAARPSLLVLLGSEDFEKALRGCCAELRVMTPEQRLDWFDAEHQATEMVHNFGRADAVLAGDEGILVGANSTYFHNLWEIEMLQAELPPDPANQPHPNNATNPTVNCSLQQSIAACENTTRDAARATLGKEAECKWVSADRLCMNLTSQRGAGYARQTTDVVEVGLYGFPPFKNKTANAGEMPGSFTFAEAMQRPVYTAYNHRKVDVGNPMFGHVSAIFSPDYVHNMTLIAPADTGAWDPSCNKSESNAFNGSPENFVCSKLQNESACDDQKRKGGSPCDWRRGSCVNTVTDRQLCSHQTTVTECANATGVTSSYTQKDRTPDDWWFLILHSSGCSWDASEGGKCVPFDCGLLATFSACNATLKSNYPDQEHCIWKNFSGSSSQGGSGGGKCVAVTDDLFCNGTGISKAFGGAPVPGMSAAEKCAQAFGPGEGKYDLCRWMPSPEAPKNETNTTGRCVVNKCKTLTSSDECSRYNTADDIVECVWDTSPNGGSLPTAGSCVEYDGNCTLLADEPICDLANETCAWGATNTSTVPVCHQKNGTSPPSSGGFEFNCSDDVWPGLVLGTPKSFHHILEAGVRMWGHGQGGSPGTQLGTMFRRMAEPTHTNITGTQIFKYWEAMIAGAPLYPIGIKMLVGSFPLLFGQPLGRRLQDWCTAQGWVLAWALGDASNGHPSPDGINAAPYANRTIDPLVFAHTRCALVATLHTTAAALCHCCTAPGYTAPVLNAELSLSL